MRFLKTILAMNMFHFVTVCASLLCRYPEWKFKSDVSTLQVANFLSNHLSIPGKVPSMYILVLNFFCQCLKYQSQLKKKIQNRKRTDGHVYNVILTFHCGINTQKNQNTRTTPKLCSIYTQIWFKSKVSVLVVFFKDGFYSQVNQQRCFVMGFIPSKTQIE